MSLKIHQTGGGGGGRRTPLTLGHKSNKKQSTEVIDIDSLDDLPLSQSIGKGSSKQQANSLSDGKPDRKSLIPVATDKQQHQVSSSTVSTSDSKNNAKEIATNDKKEIVNISKKDLTTTTNDKKTEKKHENGHNDNQLKDKESKSNGQHNKAEDAKKLNENNGTPSAVVETIMSTGVESSISTTSINEKCPEVEGKEKSVPKTKKQTEKEKKEKKINEENVVAGIVAASPPKRAQRAAAIQANASIASLAFEKELKGFNENGDEMESLIFDVAIPEMADNETPSTTDVSLVQESETKSDICDSPIIPIELPTSTTMAPSLPITSTPDGKQYYSQPPSSLRAISGRRSLRPMKEYSFQSSNYRESYRKINSQLDCTSNTSLNVTVGSEIEAPANESSFSFFGRGKKRERAIASQQLASTASELAEDSEMDTSIKSPKRARFDVSGFLGFVASPVTMLRARLSRAKIQATPTRDDQQQEKNTTEEVVENFSGIVGDEKMKSTENTDAEKVDVLDENNDEIEFVDVEMNDARIKENDNEKSFVDGEEVKVENEKNSKDVSDAEIANDDADIVITQTDRGRMCLLM